MLSAEAILGAGSDEQKKALLEPIATGQQIFAFAYTEPDYNWSPKAVQLQATKSGGSYTLNGTKLFVPDANVADQIIVVARTSNGSNPEDGLSMLVVDRNAPGVSVRTMTGWIGPKVCEINFENVSVDASNLLGEEGQAWGAI